MNTKKKIIILLCVLFVGYIVVYFIKNYSPIDVLEIQEYQKTILELKVGEKVQLTVKGYKYVNDEGKMKEVDINNLQIQWRATQGNVSFEVDENGKLEAFAPGLGNVQAFYKNNVFLIRDKVFSRPITVRVIPNDINH